MTTVTHNGLIELDAGDEGAPGTEAFRAAQVAAAVAGVTIRELSSLAEHNEVCELYERIWHPEPHNPPVTTELLRALAASGNYVAGAFADGVLAGACVGFFAPPGVRTLHSHIAGVSDDVRARGVGFAMKLHQRAWALQRDTETVEWTFDPLVRRNAYFNLTKLAAVSRTYLPDFYGRMGDLVNAGDDSDRLMASWPLRESRVARASGGEHPEPRFSELLDAGGVIGLDRDGDGRPAPGRLDATVVLVALPPDIEGLRREDASSAHDWRRATREVLQALLGEGGVVNCCLKEGWYVVERV